MKTKRLKLIRVIDPRDTIQDTVHMYATASHNPGTWWKNLSPSSLPARMEDKPLSHSNLHFFYESSSAMQNQLTSFGIFVRKGFLYQILKHCKDWLLVLNAIFEGYI